jgi:hypothetical protein
MLKLNLATLVLLESDAKKEQNLSVENCLRPGRKLLFPLCILKNYDAEPEQKKNKGRKKCGVREATIEERHLL